MSASRGTDAARVLRGVQMVFDEIVKANEHSCKKKMKNCSITTAFKDATIQFSDRIGAAKLKVIQCSSMYFNKLISNNIFGI